MASKKAKEKYSNSRSPMMSRKKKNQMTRSLDDLISSVDDEIDCAAAAAAVTADGAEWPEIPSVRKMAPAIMCILPPLSADFVCSVLLSLGATPLLTDDEMDVVKDLRNCKAVLVDVSAPTLLIQALMENFDPTGDILMVVAATQAGANDRKRDLVIELIDKCGPSLVTGRMADIYALGQVVVERAISSSDSDGDEDEKGVHPQISVDHSPPPSFSARKISAPAAVQSRIIRKLRMRSPTADLSPVSSPHTSPKSLTGTSPGVSPRASPSGVRRVVAGQGGRKIGRTPTLLPRVTMKGQFQDTSLLEVNVDDALVYGHKLAAHSRASIFFYETSLLTDGETDIEIMNPQTGTKYLHSLLPGCASVAAACVCSILRETDECEDILLHRFSHAMAMWCVAVEEAANHANQNGPGSMRQALIDALHYLKEPHIRSSAKLSLYCMRTGNRP